jgi:hypothetical protein
MPHPSLLPQQSTPRYKYTTQSGEAMAARSGLWCCRARALAAGFCEHCQPAVGVHNASKNTCTGAARSRWRLSIEYDGTDAAKCRLQPRAVASLRSGGSHRHLAMVRGHGSDDGSRLDVDKLYCLRSRLLVSIVEYKTAVCRGERPAVSR